MLEQKQTYGLTAPLLAAIVAAGGTSGITLYMSPDRGVSHGQMDASHQYTDSMHRQYAETVDARFNAVYASIGDVQRRVGDISEEHKELRRSQAQYYTRIVELMNTVRDALKRE